MILGVISLWGIALWLFGRGIVIRQEEHAFKEELAAIDQLCADVAHDLRQLSYDWNSLFINKGIGTIMQDHIEQGYNGFDVTNQIDNASTMIDGAQTPSNKIEAVLHAQRVILDVRNKMRG